MSNEIKITPEDSFKKTSYLIKTALKEKSDVTVVSGVYSSFTVSKVTENLVRLGYVTLSNVQTLTKVENGKRRIILTIVMKKTKDFDKLNDESEKRRQEFLEKKQKERDENMKTKDNNNENKKN